MPQQRIWNPMPRAGYAAGSRQINTREGGRFMARRRHHHKHHGRRRHNPLGIEGNDFRLAAWAAAGYVGTEVVVGKLQASMPSISSPIIGTIARAGIGIGLKFVGKMVSPNAGSGLMVGALVDAGVYLIKSYAGSALGLSAYWPTAYPVPTQSNPWGIVTKDPYAALAPAPAVMAAGTMSGGRFASRRSR